MKTIILVTAICIFGVALIGYGNAQSPTPGNDSPDCHQARIWHLQHAMKYTEASDQEYHLGAADAAYMLAEYGAGSCERWKEDASPPRFDAEGNVLYGIDAVEIAR